MNHSGSCPAADRGAKAGFTLVEVLIAMVILLGGCVLIANSWSGNIQRLQKARLNNKIAYLLQKKMTEYEIKYREKVDELPEEEAGEFEGDFKQFKWKMESKKFEMPDLSGVLTSQDGGANESLLLIVSQMRDYINESVKEITVTVTYQSRTSKKKFDNAVTTFFVDYKKEIAIGGGLGGAGGAGGTQ